MTVQDAPVGIGRGSELERLYREQGDRVWRAVFAYAGDREVANDAVAEAFAQALRRGDAMRDPVSWIWRASFRIAAGLLKERRRMSPPTVETSYEMEQPARELLAALASLPSSQRTAVVMHHSAGYSVREIASLLGTTSATVKVHLSRGRKRLRKLLEDEDA